MLGARLILLSISSDNPIFSLIVCCLISCGIWDVCRKAWCRLPFSLCAFFHWTIRHNCASVIKSLNYLSIYKHNGCVERKNITGDSHVWSKFDNINSHPLSDNDHRSHAFVRADSDLPDFLNDCRMSRNHCGYRFVNMQTQGRQTKAWGDGMPIGNEGVLPKPQLHTLD